MVNALLLSRGNLLDLIAGQIQSRNIGSHLWSQLSLVNQPAAFRNILQVLLLTGPLDLPHEIKLHSLRSRDLDGVRFSRLSLRDSCFDSCDLTNVEFSECDMRGASFRGCVFRNTRLRLKPNDVEGTVFEDFHSVFSLSIGNRYYDDPRQAVEALCRLNNKPVPPERAAHSNYAACLPNSSIQTDRTVATVSICVPSSLEPVTRELLTTKPSLMLFLLPATLKRRALAPGFIGVEVSCFTKSPHSYATTSCPKVSGRSWMRFAQQSGAHMFPTSHPEDNLLDGYAQRYGSPALLDVFENLLEVGARVRKPDQRPRDPPRSSFRFLAISATMVIALARSTSRRLAPSLIEPYSNGSGGFPIA
jgi:hypothetical protein